MEPLTEEEINDYIETLKAFGMKLSKQQEMGYKEMMRGFDKDSLNDLPFDEESFRKELDKRKLNKDDLGK